MNNFIARVSVVLRSAVTWLTLIATILAIAAEDLVELLGAESAVLVVVFRVIAWIAAAVAIIRKVTPVLDSATGLLPVDAGTPVTPREQRLSTLLDDHRNLTP